ncbi:hypothetical protein PPACK8108_LOCUS4255 [Phakopsora pachyrhizi]|uniref:Uncharacterized protein n=1 Tax=Phakopsora pachyrhizi TaxID=170000 RepID=A0AAV0AN08_PHAPC|nr:hypothetical protein PPACK8108_LOCUS4255 [Phakopsora pachyrhizi]
MTVLVDEQVREPTNKKQEGVLDEDHDLWSEVSRESVSGWSSCELDYDLSRWKPEEYEYLKTAAGLLRLTKFKWYEASKAG